MAKMAEPERARNGGDCSQNGQKFTINVSKTITATGEIDQG